MECVRCGAKDAPHYAHDRTCKECRKAMVRANRKANIDHYRAYDKERFQNDPRVLERIKRYQQTVAGKMSKAKTTKRFRAENPEKYKAHGAVNNAVRDGRLQKLDACESCGSQDNIVGHHSSYADDMRLCVTWLCQGCHVQLHKDFVLTDGRVNHARSHQPAPLAIETGRFITQPG